jgi:hypothetical protein
VGLVCSAVAFAVSMLGAATVFAQGVPGAPPAAGGPRRDSAARRRKPALGGGSSQRCRSAADTVSDAGSLDKELTQRQRATSAALGSRRTATEPGRVILRQLAWRQYIRPSDHERRLRQQSPFNKEGQKVMDRRLIAQDQQIPYITPAIVCRPAGPVWDLIRIPFRIFQSKDKLDVFSDGGRMWWQIALNPALAQPAGPKSYMGRSVGHWDGNTLSSKPQTSSSDGG